MHNRPSTSYEMAVRDFQRARQSAVLRQMLARLRGQSTELLDYEAICQQLQPSDQVIDRGVVEIPLQKIVGSVGRYRDFTRDFLPKQRSDESRWAKVKSLITDMSGLPPIDVYQIGDAYFVLDGNHRVSVACKAGAETIAARVTEVQTRVPFLARDNPDEIICKSRYVDFLNRTNLDKAVPQIDLLMTVAGHYQTLLKQIALHHQWMTVEGPESSPETGPESSPERDSEAISCDDGPSLAMAALAWYNAAYLPVINIVRELGVMRRFPNRTETDIYVLLSERRDILERELQWDLDLEEMLPNLVHVETTSAEEPKPFRALTKMVSAIGPKIPEPVAVGGWRSQQVAMHREGRLFADLLVLFEGTDEDWDLLEAALTLAAYDHDRILGLVIVEDVSQLERTWVREMRARFYRRCQSAKLHGEFAVEIGDGATVLLNRAAWADLVLINLTHPPESNVLDRLRSFWGPVITSSPRPLLIAPHARYHGMNRILLAYDGSPKADEALFLATYHASRWKHELTVLTVETAFTKPDALERARAYLEDRGLSNVTYRLKAAPIGTTIMETALEENSDMIMMGGFGANPVRRLLSGSAVEYVLQHTADQVVMICQ